MRYIVGYQGKAEIVILAANETARALVWVDKEADKAFDC